MGKTFNEYYREEEQIPHKSIDKKNKKSRRKVKNFLKQIDIHSLDDLDEDELDELFD